MSVSRGNTSLVEGPINIVSIPGRGGTTKRTWTGTESQIRAQANTMFAVGYQVEMNGGPVWTLTATLSAENTQQENLPEQQWEIVPHALERNILECTDRNFIASLSASTKGLIEYRIKNPTSEEALTTDSEFNQFENAWLVYNLMRAGVEARQEFTVAVRRTIIVSRNYNAGWSLGNVGKVLSLGTLVSAYNVPNYVANLLPGSDNGIQNEASSVSPIYTFRGYLEQHPTYQSVAGNKISIAQEWLFNRWSAGPNGLYDVV